MPAADDSSPPKKMKKIFCIQFLQRSSVFLLPPRCSKHQHSLSGIFFIKPGTSRHLLIHSFWYVSFVQCACSFWNAYKFIRLGSFGCFGFFSFSSPLYLHVPSQQTIYIYIYIIYYALLILNEDLLHLAQVAMLSSVCLQVTARMCVAKWSTFFSEYAYMNQYSRVWECWQKGRKG